jgi:hypothetical protein
MSGADTQTAKNFPSSESRMVLKRQAATKLKEVVIKASLTQTIPFLSVLSLQRK